MIKEVKSFKGLQYIIRYPNNYSEGDKYPILFLMHGAGSRGTDIDVLMGNPFFGITDKHKDFPFISVSPQCNRDSWFDVFETVLKLVRYIYNCDFTDKKRFYGIGSSMGGYAIWQMAMSLPEIFAAIVPVCGGGMYWNAGRLKNVPVWAFHGDSDKVVFTEESVKMVNAVNNSGGNAKLTVYENCEHNAWTATYENKEVFGWLLSNIKIQGSITSNGFDNAEIYG